VISLQTEYPRQTVCCFTGHRPAKLPWGSRESDPRCLELKSRLYDVVDALYWSGIRHFICGMAMGTDTYCCEAVLRLKREHPEITLEAALPCGNQADGWYSEARRRHEELLSRCTAVTVLQETYSPGCMQRRNQYMVSRSSVLVAVFDGSAGGTRDTIRRAEKEGLEVIALQP